MSENKLRKIVGRLGGRGSAPAAMPQGAEGVKKFGHRAYVGGLWDEMGALQFEFMKSQGLQPSHYLLDAGCGSLRAGVHFIPYLETGHYLGMDKEDDLIRLGIDQELGAELYERKKPQLLVSSDFEFEKFTARPDFAVAQSLFTHLPVPLIERCFVKMRAVAHPETAFYATFFESDAEVANSSEPNDFDAFAYPRAQIERFGTANGWQAHYIGDWNHPRGQIMVRFTPAL